MLRFLMLTLAVLAVAPTAMAETVRVAVAANFRTVLTALQPEFEAASGAKVQISAGSTGQLAAQIGNGAPFDVFLSADQIRPARLVADGLAVAKSQFTYATGRLALLAPGVEIPQDGSIPDLGDLNRMSIANPRTAPYGVAAMEVLDQLDIAGEQLVLAHNAGGVVAAVASGAAPAGVTALSLAKDRGQLPAWPIPAELHMPLHQDAVLLTTAAQNQAAIAFLDWLKGQDAQHIIRSHGYALD